MHISENKRRLLDWEIAHIQSFLGEFEPVAGGAARRAWFNPTGEYIVVQRMPLPDGFNPDWVDLLLSIVDYPATPPIGIYLLNDNNESVITSIKTTLNAFRDRAFHEAEALPGYTWVCCAYADNRWNYNPNNPRMGDNIGKFLGTLHGYLEQEARGR